MDTPRHEVHGNKGEFFLQEDGRRVAKLTYSMAGDIAIINHTEVDASLRGTGAGNQLVDALVAWARAHHKRVMPLCPFARSVFDRTPEYRDVCSA